MTFNLIFRLHWADCMARFLFWMGTLLSSSACSSLLGLLGFRPKVLDFLACRFCYIHDTMGLTVRGHHNFRPVSLGRGKILLCFLHSPLKLYLCDIDGNHSYVLVLLELGSIGRRLTFWCMSAYYGL